MLESDFAITLFLTFIMLNIFIPMIVIRIKAFYVISFIIAIISICFSAYIVTNPDLTEVVYVSAIYLSNGTLLQAGQWLTYTSTMPFHPTIEIFLIFLSVFNMILLSISGKK